MHSINITNNTILLQNSKSSKYRIDICEPSNLIYNWKTFDEYYQSYYELNHGSFFVIRFDKVSKELYLFDSEYHYLLKLGMVDGKPIQKMDINDENHVYIIPSELESKCINCNRCSKSFSNGFCALRGCQEKNNEINLPFDKLITLNEFYEYEVAEEFVISHSNCESCQNNVKFNLISYMNFNFNEYRFDLFNNQLLDEYIINKNNKENILYIHLHILNGTYGKEFIKNNKNILQILNERINKIPKNKKFLKVLSKINNDV